MSSSSNSQPASASTNKSEMEKARKRKTIRLFCCLPRSIEVIELYQKYTKTDDVVSSKNVMDFAIDKFFNLEGGSERVILQAFFDEFRDDMSVNSLTKTFFVNKISKNIGGDFRLAQAITTARGDIDRRLCDVVLYFAKERAPFLWSQLRTCAFFTHLGAANTSARRDTPFITQRATRFEQLLFFYFACQLYESSRAGRAKRDRDGRLINQVFPPSFERDTVDRIAYEIQSIVRAWDGFLPSVTVSPQRRTCCCHSFSLG